MTKFEYRDFESPQKVKGRIRAGADVNALVGDKTPLALAACGGHVESCRLLLEAGANPDVAGKSDDIGSVLAQLFDSRFSVLNSLCGIHEPVISDEAMEAISTMLLEYGANPNGGDGVLDAVPSKRCALYIAVSNGDVRGVEVLGQLGANVDQKCQDEERGYEVTPMSQAHSKGNQEMIVALLRLGATPLGMQSGNQWLNGFHASVYLGKNRVVEYYVRERGENLEQTVVYCGRRHTMTELASDESTKHLLHSLATELAIQNTLDIEIGESMPVVDSKRNLGMAL